MAYRLSIADDVPSSVRTCAREQLAGAVERLERADEDPVKAVHEARKHLKKTRALLRLVRPALGKHIYRSENDALRDAGLALSGTRDADVLMQTVDKLAEHAAGRLPADTFDQLSDVLAGEAAAARRAAGPAPVPSLVTVLETLRAAELRVEEWPLDDANWKTVLAAIGRAYARGRDAFAVARATPEPELLHAWRKRAKDLWYHQRLLALTWPALLGAQAEEAHALTELLGDDHDRARRTPHRRSGPAPARGRRRARRPARARRASQRRAAHRRHATRSPRLRGVTEGLHPPPGSLRPGRG
jgi:CHAD domain-containing protein